MTPQDLAALKATVSAAAAQAQADMWAVVDGLRKDAAAVRAQTKGAALGPVGQTFELIGPGGQRQRVVALGDPRYITLPITVTAAATTDNPAIGTLQAPFDLVVEYVTVYVSDSARLKAAKLAWKYDNGEAIDFRSPDASGTIIRPALESLFTEATSDRPLVPLNLAIRKDRNVKFEAEPLEGLAPFDIELTFRVFELVPA